MRGSECKFVVVNMLAVHAKVLLLRLKVYLINLHILFEDC
jgi:hypothetical protein